MMITIHGLPPKTTFQAVKALVKQECNIIDFILDNLVDDGPNSKKVRIGLSNDAEGYRIAKCLNGFRMSPSHLLKIVPVGKPLNPPSQHNYDERARFPPRNDYTNQSRSDYPNQPVDDYGNRGAHSFTDTRKGNYVPPNQRHLGPHGALDTRSSESMRPIDVRPHTVEQRPHGLISHGHPSSNGPQDAIRSQDWGLNVNTTSNQWLPQAQGQMQGPNNTYNQMTSQPSFGQQGAQRDTRQHVLREVDIVDTARVPTRSYEHDKPITIMKDNFQGPTQYVAGQFSQHGNYSGPVQTPAPTWSQPSKLSYDDRRHQPLDKRPDVPKPQEYEKRGHFIPIGNARPLTPPRRTSPSRVISADVGRNYDDSGRGLSPGRSFPGSERRVSPSRLGPPVNRLGPPVGRLGPPVGEYSPSGRRVSPAGRKASPSGRGMSPIGRRVSPGRRISPTGRKISPIGRRLSPGRRGDSRRMSPSDRRMGRRESPRRFSPKRDSPSRRLESPPPRPIRYSRPSPGRLADKTEKFMNIGKGVKPVRPAYEPTHAQNQTYTGGYRPNVQENVQYPITGHQPEQRNSPWLGDKIMYPSGMKKDEERREMTRRLERQTSKSPGRLSRSPARRNRSPLKDRYRRHSPSPRSSRSPRRSWALEKRSSPEAIKEPPPPPIWPGQEADVKATKSRFDDDSKHVPVWDVLDRRPDEDRRTFEAKLRVRTDLEDNFGISRREIDDRREYRDDGDRKQLERDREYHRPEHSGRDSPRRDNKKVFMDLDKDFQDIYKRAVEFRKRTEERKSGERRREEYESQEREEQPYRRERSPRRERSRDREDFTTREWNTTDRKRLFLSPSVKSKRDKAVDEISNRILDKYEMSNDQRYRLMEELRLSLSNIFIEMFSNKDVSFIELVIKYQAKYSTKEEDKLVQDLLSRLPSQFRNLKRKADADTSEVLKKTSRRSPAHDSREERNRVVTGRKKLHTDRKQYSNNTFERTISVVKKPAVTKNVVITKKAVKYGRPNYQADDTRAKKTTSQQKITQSAPKGPTVQKKPVVPPSVEPTLDGHYELSPLLSKMLEAELRDVMSKVWNLVPNDSRDDAERLVAERFRNKAGDELRNAIGMNVTKRLLNVHNPLYVKIVFSSKPIRPDLTNFIKKHNISAFKKVGTKGALYAAKLHNFQDFDDLCTNKNLKCGNVRVTVTPCYQFMKCPPNLRTRYDGNETNIINSMPVPAIQQTESTEEKTHAQNATPKVTPSKQPTTQVLKSTPKETVINQPAATQAQKSGPQTTPTKQPTAAQAQSAAPKATPNKQPVASQAQKSTPKATPNKQPAATQAQKATPKATPNKQPVGTQAQNPTTAKSAVTTQAQKATPKATPNKQPAATQVPNTTTAKSQVSTQAQNAVPKTTLNKQPAVTQAQNPGSKSSPTKPATNQNAAPKVALSKSVTDNNTKTAQPKPAVVNKQNIVPRATKPKQISPKKKIESDFDELDDHDILALITEGIVLDECSGSEED